MNAFLQQFAALIKNASILKDRIPVYVRVVLLKIRKTVPMWIVSISMNVPMLI